MKKTVTALALLLVASAAEAEEITCKGNIISVQGEGMVARQHRFEVGSVTGSDLMAVLENCRKIARERQNRAARRNPGGNFRSSSELVLECTQGSEKFQVRRTLQTRP